MPIVNSHLLEQNPEGKVAMGPRILAKEGPFFEIFVSIPQALVEYNTRRNIPLPAPISGIALMDTGASHSCIHGPIMKELQVSPIGVATNHTPAGTTTQSLFPAHFSIPTAKIEIDFTTVIGVDLTGRSIP
jgi:hypothetical protein